MWPNFLGHEILFVFMQHNTREIMKGKKELAGKMKDVFGGALGISNE
jgi:hypothetical protein